MFRTVSNPNDSGSPMFEHALITQVGQTEIDFCVWIFLCSKEARGHRGEIISFAIEFLIDNHFSRCFEPFQTPMIQDHQRLDMPSLSKWVRLKSIFCAWIFWFTKEARGHWGEIISFVIKFSVNQWLTRLLYTQFSSRIQNLQHFVVPALHKCANLRE